jgi:hypothetical protein
MTGGPVRIEAARGIANAQKIINAILTANYLPHEAIPAQLSVAKTPHPTAAYIPPGANGIPLVKNM